MPSPSTQKVTGFFCSSRMAFSSGSKPGSGRSSRSSRVPSSERRARKRMIKSGLARWRNTGISWLSAMVSSRNAPWWSSGPSASIQAVRPMKAGHRPSPSSPWLPEKGFAPVTARISSSSGRKSCPSVRSAWGISAAPSPSVRRFSATVAPRGPPRLFSSKIRTSTDAPLCGALLPGGAKAARAPLRLVQLVHQLHVGLDHRRHHQLGDAVPGLDGIFRFPGVI